MVTAAPPLARASLRDRIGSFVAGVAAAVLGAAPHVLHHAGPLAGAAVLAGARGQLLFGALGFALAVPMLRRLRRRTGSWRAPLLALSAMTVVFTVSTAVIGPALTSGNDATRPSETNDVPAGPAAEQHQSHHEPQD